MAMLSSMLRLLAFVVPIAFPAAAFLLGARVGFWWKAVLVILASLLSLPAGFVLMLLASDTALLTHDHVNPGIGVAAIPMMFEWAATFAATVLVTIFFAARKMFFRATKERVPN